jgi:hypothetical protein
MIVTKDNFPEVCAGFRLIEEDNGGHLIGRVYPGEPINLEAFEVPDGWSHMLAPAEAGLSRLRRETPELWDTFVIGDERDVFDIAYRQKDLDQASILFNAFFDGWQATPPPV